MFFFGWPTKKTFTLQECVTVHTVDEWKGHLLSEFKRIPFNFPTIVRRNLNICRTTTTTATSADN